MECETVMVMALSMVTLQGHLRVCVMANASVDVTAIATAGAVF